MKLLNSMKRFIRSLLGRDAIKFLKSNYFKFSTGEVFKNYRCRFNKFAFTDCRCEYPEQFEASIIRFYHIIEKGLSYNENYRAGFGQEAINDLLSTLEEYSSKYSTHTFFYETALACLNEYIRKNEEYGHKDPDLKRRVENLPGHINHSGGTITVSAPDLSALNKMNYEQLIKSRHSIRHFSQKPVDIELISNAIKLAQHTPSACNRQGWRTRVVIDKNIMNTILSNQNGNAGFGQEIDKLLVVTSDIMKQQKSREIFQAFIDGGMYAQNVLNALHYSGIGTIPLSASLTVFQENNVRKVLKLSDAEVFIMFIGVGNYPDGEFLTTRSERKPIKVEVI